jgi:ubiquinone/menaquinone biosynthesis C-methylase UbiE
METGEHAKRFNRGAQGYTTDRYPGRGQCMRKVLALLDPKPDDVVLDVGCGPGTQLIGLAPCIRSGYGVDPAEQMIRRATDEAAGCPNLHFHVGSAQRLPDDVRVAGVNKIFSNYALHHLADETKCAAIHGLSALLPADGRLVLGDLMFSDDPTKHHDLHEYSGYGPGSDTPAHVSALERMFRSAGLRPTTHVLNPLIGVIVGTKTP